MLPDIQPGNTKILYFFNCLLDGMHTTIPYICDFSRCRLNVRVKALASNLCSEATNMLYLSKEGCILAGEEIAIYPLTARRLRPLRWEMNCVCYLLDRAS